jgi:hypothetical protein
VEKFFLFEMLSQIPVYNSENQVVAVFNLGPKNQPAYDFLMDFFYEEDNFWVLDLYKLELATRSLRGDIIK